ncbi:MAG: tetratricopeptide repeat protein [Calothrix sp. MO_167.B12]|nr:tetratricopeptide repeat protein [Calothrix sp. MO_167.B12]
MSLTFTFALSQSQTFELRCDYGTRRLDTTALAQLIELCEAKYYSQKIDNTTQLTNIGRELYSWLDGKEGWLRRALEETDEQVIYLDLIQTSEAQGLNPQTQKVALGLAHLPWELLHNGTVFLRNILPVRSVQQRTSHVLGKQNRPLRLLFMATSPEYPGIAPLQFEQEEANILQATERQPLALVVEESGSVAELANLVQSYPEDHFDVFHLTGHGVIYTEKAFGKLLPKGKKIEEYTPCFITEDEVGNVVLTTAEDLGKAFKRRFPRVIFLSGCHTGQLANQGTVPSMAQALVKAGAGVVLGWARPVFDRTGIIAAQAFYQALATGATVEDAVKAAQQEMIEEERSDWHLLRIYRDTRPIEELVTPLRTKKRERLRFTPPEREFLDENNLVKVASRREFVGRRRALQRCLRALQQTSDNIGVFIAGMGGLGKSSLAARLCTRVQSQRENFQRVVLVGVVDEVGLLNQLSSKYQRFAGVPGLLNEPGISLQGRLQNFLAEIEDTHDMPLLLVLDDFEQNIPQANIADGSLRMSQAAYSVLEALCGALAENQGESRLIVTCRYLKEDILPAHSLHLESLAGMGKGDINKIVRDLEQGVKEKVQEKRIIRIADGNPRLLKWLLDVVQQPGIDGEDLLKQLEQTQQEFRENILARMLLDGLEDGERQFLAQLSVFRLPVREEIVSSIWFPDSGWESTSRGSASTDTGGRASQTAFPGGTREREGREREQREILTKLTSLSLVESATVYATQEREYRVTRVLEPLLSNVLTQEEWQTTRKAATQSIYKSCWEESGDTYNEEQAREIVRLGVLAEEKEIAVTVGDAMATNWVNGSRYVEAWELCRDILQLGEDYRILGTVARAESTLGLVGEALTHYQTALELCPEDDDLTIKASIIHNMALLKAQQGEIEDAIALYNQSLEITESINNVRGKAATLHEMAGLKTQQGEIEDAIALYNQSLEITESINDVQGKATTLNNIGYLKEQQGDIEAAIALYNQSLEIEESINDVGGKAATLHQMAGLKAQQGEIEDAIALYNQSLEIKESINDVRGKAATLHQMGHLKAQQGEIEDAIALYNQSLEIKESINNVQGKAPTLNNLAKLAYQTGDIPKAVELLQQAAQAFAEIHAYVDLRQILYNLGIADESKGIIYLAQAVWLCLRVEIPLINAVDTLEAMYNLVPQGDEMEALLGATAVYLYQLRSSLGLDPRLLEEVWDLSVKILTGAAAAQGIETEEDFKTWYVQQGLNDAEYFIPRLVEKLEEIVGDGWLFERF